MFCHKNYLKSIGIWNNYLNKKFKRSIISWISIGKVQRIIKFSQKVWVKLYIGINIKLKKEKYDFENDLYKLMNIVVFEKTMENVGKNRDIKLVTTDTKSNYLV